MKYLVDVLKYLAITISFLLILSSCDHKSTDSNDAFEIQLEFSRSVNLSDVVSVLHDRLDYCEISDYSISKTKNTILVQVDEKYNQNLLTILLSSRGVFELAETYEQFKMVNTLSEINRLLSDSSLIIPNLVVNDNEDPLFNYLKPANKFLSNRGPYIGVAKINDTSQINLILHSSYAICKLPKDIKLVWSYKPVGYDGEYGLIATKRKTFTKSQAQPNSIKDITLFKKTNSYEISLFFGEKGKKRLNKLTKENVGKSLALTFDDKLISLINLDSVIDNGRISFLLKLPKEELNILMSLMKSESIPSLTIIENK